MVMALFMDMERIKTFNWEANLLISPKEMSVNREATITGPAITIIWSISQSKSLNKNNGVS